MFITANQAHKIAFTAAGSQHIEVNEAGPSYPPGWIKILAPNMGTPALLDEGGNIVGYAR